ncbi:MAG: 16S rRNA (cytosine(967)-C(5))-methyltransferase RsmB, partial [Clostridia bacterium]|nr:16S rRNA (cytosine(967)-C(5))-methyltransferase RsmB [Clostridia bacterium]
MSTLSKPREAALKALVSCEKDGAYLNIVLRDILSSMSMESRDNALATVLSFGVMKNRLYIDNIIENLSTVKIKKLSVWIHNILRIGIYSIKFLDRSPVSATVNE